MFQHYSSNPTLDHSQNHGYEYLSSIYRMKEEYDLLSSRGITPHIIPIKVVVVACLAIVEYVNVAGFRVDPAWEEFDHENESVKDRLDQIYKLIGTPINFDTGIWKEVLMLFETEKQIKLRSRGLIRYHENEIPDLIKEVITNYPIQLSQAVAENAIELLLAHSSLSYPLERVMLLV